MSTVTNKSHVVSVPQHHHDKSRQCLRIVLILIGIIILLATLFLAIVIYTKLKSGLQRKGVSSFDSNYTDSNRSQAWLQSCQYGRVECEFGATCTEQDQCQCLFDCGNVDEPVHDNITDEQYPNQCELDRARCNFYYRTALKGDSACSSFICSHGAKCEIGNNGSPRCFCPDNCFEYARMGPSDRPVCGTDNQTYPNLCELNKRACQMQQDFTLAHVGECHHQRCHNSKCDSIVDECDSHIRCPSNNRPLCASNLQQYPNECEMHKYACQSQVRLTKLHDGICHQHELEQHYEACKALVCFHGKKCTVEDGVGVCRCIFDCPPDGNQICASNHLFYRNQCKMERDSCLREENLTAVNASYCLLTCETLKCPYGRCIERENVATCECKQCSDVSYSSRSERQLICGDNGITYPSKCQLEYDACNRQTDIKPNHMGRCDNCHNVTCPFHGQCQSEQGNYTCVCPSRKTCASVRENDSYSFCASNLQLFSSQCEMDIRSCELKMHLYAIAPQHCTNKPPHRLAKDQNEEYNRDCGSDEPLLDLISNRNAECDTGGRCPMSSYCNTHTNRCCVKVITAVLPYRMCSSDMHCGRNMICLSGLCECVRQDFIPARKKRECISIPYLSDGLTCVDSAYGCCNDTITISPSFDRRGCPEYCNCHPVGSLQASCDPMTGSCYCRPAVGGSSCSHCENEYWGFSRIMTHNNTGCTPCGCNPLGSIRKDCLQDSGECSCKPHTTGRQCDRCIDPSKTLTERGCVNLVTSNRRRQPTCRDLICLFEGICHMLNGRPQCTCHQVSCTVEEQRRMDMCASDGRTYKSKCAIKRQQCIKQYEISLIYPGVCVATDEQPENAEEINDEYFPFVIDGKPVQQSENLLDYSSIMMPIDSKRCVTHTDCGENMVCLADFCECAKQKYQRMPGPRCVAPGSIQLSSNYTLNPVRRTTIGACLRRTPCENQATCQDRPDGNYKCLCAFGWQGRHCNEKFEVTIPHFHRQSFFELKPQQQITMKKTDHQLLRIDLIFASEHHHGLLLYADDKFAEFFFIITLRNRIVDITVRFDQLISTIQLPEIIELETYVRLQVQILSNEIRARLNDGNISSKSFPFGNSFKSTLYLGGLPDSLVSLYQQYHLDEGFQGCIHALSINGRAVAFNSSQHHTIVSAQNIDECIKNPCRSLVTPCQNGTRCMPIRNYDANSYKCLCEDNSSISGKNCSLSSIDRCSTKPCGDIQYQCINVYPNNFTCICVNCSSNRPYIASFSENSYIKQLPLQPSKDTGEFRMEFWFLTETSSGLLVYSEHNKSKGGHLIVLVQRRFVMFSVALGTKTISLSSRYPIELHKWHRCSIQIHGQKFIFIVDQEAPVVAYELFSASALWPRSFTFIGGLPSEYQLSDLLSISHTFEGLRGAIQKIILNDYALNDIRENAIELFNLAEFNGFPCRPNPCASNQICRQMDLNNYTCDNNRLQYSSIDSGSLQFDGTNGVIYPYSPSNYHRNRFELSFKTKISVGLIFYIGNSGQDVSSSFFSQFISLTLVNGLLQFTIKIDRNTSANVVQSKVRVDDGQWHRVELERFRRRILMKLDGDHHYRRLMSANEMTSFHPNPSFIFLGGYRRLCGRDEQYCRTFRGCLKHFSIDTHPIDLQRDETSKHHPLTRCDEVAG